jgi:alcohol dehydrogenase class IV
MVPFSMVPFSIEMPRSIQVGAGSFEALSALVAGKRRVLVVSGARWLSRSPWAGVLEGLLAGCDLLRIACPDGEPTTESLALVCGTARSFSAECIVGIGGGSVLDSAKALSALLAHEGPVERYLEGVDGAVSVPGPCIPWIAIPTTAGTGAEVTKNAVIRAPGLGVKRSMRSAHLLAAAVLVDPRMTLSLPLRTTGTCGLDALTQLLEAYVSKKTNPYVRALVVGAFAPMLDALRRLPRAPEDLELRSAASWGALVSGIALANGGLGAAHGFAAGIGGVYDIPHGLLCAVLLPPVLEANASSIAESVAELAGAAGVANRDPVGWFAGEVRSLLGAYGLPLDLRGFGIPRSMIAELSERSSGSSMKGNPRELSAEERQAILSSVL